MWRESLTDLELDCLHYSGEGCCASPPVCTTQDGCVPQEPVGPWLSSTTAPALTYHRIEFSPQDFKMSVVVYFLSLVLVLLAVFAFKGWLF
jgi:hypothetical protein